MCVLHSGSSLCGHSNVAFVVKINQYYSIWTPSSSKVKRDHVFFATDYFAKLKVKHYEVLKFGIFF